MKKEVPAFLRTGCFLLLCRLWDARIFLLKVCALGILTGIIISVSIPNEYESSILTAPESTSDKSYPGTGFSTDMGLGGKKIQDAIIPSLYPHVIHSTPFLLSLFDVPVTLYDKQESDTLPLADYLSAHQRSPWWSVLRSGFARLVSFPFALLGGKESDDSVILQDTVSRSGESSGTFYLSKHEAAIAAALSRRIKVDVDKKRRTVTLRVRMQDPLVSATVADSVLARLRTFVSDYRTEKERVSLEYTKNLQCQAREKYYEAQEAYAHFADANRLLSLKSYQKDLYNLRLAKNLAYKDYVETSRQLQLARIRVYKTRPVLAVIEPATVPQHPVSPSMKKILFVCFLLSLVIGYCCLLRCCISGKPRCNKM